MFVLGLDYGTNSVRSLIVRVADGEEIATNVWNYRRGTDGVRTDPNDPNLARQYPQDYIDGAVESIRAVLEAASATEDFSAQRIVGIGIDTTGSTPLPVRADGRPLADDPAFADNPAALAWLWKDHTSVAEAEEITERAAADRPQYLAKCGGVYSSEWFWAKILHCKRSAPEVFEAAASWMEIADWIPATLTGTEDPGVTKRSICAAGHKAMFNPDWGGYPDADFLSSIDPGLGELRRSLPDKAYTVEDAAGELTREWADKLGLPEGVPVAVGAFDAHLGGVGSGIKPGTLVKNIGTSTCDMMVVPFGEKLADIPGVSGIVPGSILPGHHGIEAGQSAVGDIFNWYVNNIRPGGPEAGSHAELTKKAESLRPGQSGLLALDWHNGNRTILVDQRLTGLILGLTIHSRPEEVYRAWVEATAFGARVIMERLEEYGQTVQEIVNCGGISVKNPMAMQIYADVMARPLRISRSEQTAALGAAMAGAVVAKRGGHSSFDDAIAKMTGTLEREFHPIPANVAIYNRLYHLYRRLHDSFGQKQGQDNLYDVMKELLRIREEVRS